MLRGCCCRRVGALVLQSCCGTTELLTYHVNQSDAYRARRVKYARCGQMRVIKIVDNLEKVQMMENWYGFGSGAWRVLLQSSSLQLIAQEGVSEVAHMQVKVSSYEWMKPSMIKA